MHRIVKGNKNLIISFGGMALQFGGILPFEFLKYLSANYSDCDLIFFIDKDQCWYHKGFSGITENIDDTVKYLNDIVKNYEKVIFMGVSAGGYAAILFGSLCVGVTNVVSFIPQTMLDKPVDVKYGNIKFVINNNVKYLLYGDTNGKDLHHVSHCENLESFANVKVVKSDNINLINLRDNGTIKNILDEILKTS